MCYYEGPTLIYLIMHQVRVSPCSVYSFGSLRMSFISRQTWSGTIEYPELNQYGIESEIAWKPCELENQWRYPAPVKKLQIYMGTVEKV